MLLEKYYSFLKRAALCFLTIACQGTKLPMVIKGIALIINKILRRMYETAII